MVGRIEYGSIYSDKVEISDAISPANLSTQFLQMAEAIPHRSYLIMARPLSESSITPGIQKELLNTSSLCRGVHSQQLDLVQWKYVSIVNRPALPGSTSSKHIPKGLAFVFPPRWDDCSESFSILGMAFPLARAFSHPGNQSFANGNIAGLDSSLPTSTTQLYAGWFHRKQSQRTESSERRRGARECANSWPMEAGGADE